MRLVAALLTLGLLGAAGLAGKALWTELSAPPSPPVPAEVMMASAGPLKPPAPPRRWPALFGEPQPPAPPEPEPQPPEPPGPPLASLGYSLKGLVRSGGATWALLSHPTGERVIRPGDALGGGLLVMVIDAQGVWIGAQGEEPQLLAFDER